MKVRCPKCGGVFNFHENYCVSLVYSDKELSKAKIFVHCPFCNRQYQKIVTNEDGKLKEKLKKLGIF